MQKADPDKVVKDIGRRLAELRADRGWTQEQFAVRLGVTAGYVGRLERGTQSFTVHRLVWLANNLGVRAADLFAAPRSRVVRPGRPKRAARKAAS